MSGVALILGPITFSDFEVPIRINFGGTQRLAIHRLAGGGRIIDSLGRDDADICFSGVFSGSNAMARARMLDELRAAGLPLPLTWDVLFYTVVVRAFIADYRNGWWIPYRIVCSVLRDEASFALELAASLGASLIADVATAVAQAASAGMDISAIQSVMSAPGVTVRDSEASVSAQTSLESTRLAVSSAAMSAGDGVPDFATMQGGSADDGIGWLNSALNSTRGLAMLNTANSYLGRAAANLSNAGT